MLMAGARRNNHQIQNPKLHRSQSDVVNGGGAGKSREKPISEAPKLPLSNLERFLEAITPSAQAQYVSKTTLRGWGTCDMEFQPYFMLSDLWESLKEWSAYGAGVPLVLNGSDSAIQYYVPYLSGIQIYVDPSKSLVKSRCTSDDIDEDNFSRDSSSDGSSGSERDRGLKCSRSKWRHCSHPSSISLEMERLFLRDQHTALQEGFLCHEGESGSLQHCLLFEYLEHDQPYRREPLADKISDLAERIPELKSLRSCDLLASSWFSVAWYPIYRIPTGPTLKDLDACFLTYHSLYTPIEDVSAAQARVVIYPSEVDEIPRISLPVFGLASYKFGKSLWTSKSGSDTQLVKSLQQAADSWLTLLQVHHPDYMFFSRNGYVDL